MDVWNQSIFGGDLIIGSFVLRSGEIRAVPTGLESLICSLPRTALRLSWAILDGSLREQSDRPSTCGSRAIGRLWELSS
jgi:hypothetical protein